jgi:hypothetical protein
MATQVQHLQEELIRAEARLGKDAPWVRALRQQLEGYRSMEANREQRFLTGAIPKSDSAGATLTTETEEDAKIVQDRRRFRALQSSRAQQARIPASSQSQSSTPETTASNSSVKRNTSE